METNQDILRQNKSAFILEGERRDAMWKEEQGVGSNVVPYNCLMPPHDSAYHRVLNH
jgi:hypothetical protein